jgi:c-di-GMP-binding flagellar brake protein YcgR
VAPDEVPPPVLPELRQRVHVRLGRWAVSLPSIVEDVDGAELVVAAPLDLSEGQEPERDERLLVMWEDQAGPHTLPCSFRSVVARELPQWRVQPDGVAKGDQRRRHVRASTEGQATIVRDQAVLTGDLLDVSEGGIRCRLADAGALAGVGDVVSCTFAVGSREMDLRGRVVQVHLEVGRPRVLAISFLDLSGSQADELRRHVFAEQARVRARTVR